MLYEWAALGFKEHFPTDINVLGSYVKPYRISMVMCGMNTVWLHFPLPPPPSPVISSLPMSVFH